MAPRPKTYGARRSHIKPAGELVNGNTADESEHGPKKIDFISMKIRTGKDKGLATAPKEEKQNIPSQGPVKEDALASAETVGECAAPEYQTDIEVKPTNVSPVPWSLRKRKMSAQDMLPPDTPGKEQSLRRKSIRKSVDGSATLQNQNTIIENGFQPVPAGHGSPSYAKATDGPNGIPDEHQPASVTHDINLKDKPSEIDKIDIWIAQLIRKFHHDGNLPSVISEQRQADDTPQPEHNTKTTDALDNVEDVRMTRGKEKKRLQQLKGKELANGNAMTDLSQKFLTGSGRSLRLKDAAPVERLLKDQLNDLLKQRLFGSSSTTDVSTNVTERDACGKLLFNTVVDLGDSDRTSSAILNTALEERKDDAPFISALKILASSSEVMSFINFYFSKEDGRLLEIPKLASSRLSTGAEVSGTAIILNGRTRRPGKLISDPENLLEDTTRSKAIGKKNAEKQKRSQEAIQAFEAATTVLIHIQQGEAGTNYVTPYASGSAFSGPVGQRHLITYGTAYGPPFSKPPIHGMTYGPPPIGPNVNNYASPFIHHLAPHPNSYASPYSNPMNQPPTKYASPYASPMVSSSIGLVGDGNTINHNNSEETRHSIKEAHTSKPDVTGTEVENGNEGAACQYISNQEKTMRMSSKKADEVGTGHSKNQESKAYGEAIPQDISKGNEMMGNIIDLAQTNVGESKKHESIDEDGETSSDNDLTGDDLPVAMLKDKNVTPPAENHKLFTGERLGDFTSVEKIDWLLTMGNGGKMPTPRKKRTTRSPSISPPSRLDDQVHTEVSKIIDEIMLYKGWPGHPGATTKQLFYASAEGQRLAAELRRLMVIAKPVVNAIVPGAESKARLGFYQQLESRAIKEKRDRELQGGVSQFHGPPVQIQQWIPPATIPNSQLPMALQLPSSGPMEAPFIRRGNVIAAPPGGRNIEEEQKAETYGFPPVPGSRPGDSQQGQKKKKRSRKH